MTDHPVEHLKTTLARWPGWAAMTAYERAKIFCSEAVRGGQKIPSWMIIRTAIEKGSANDIQRAINDARTEHAETLRKMEGVSAGIPDEVTAHIKGLWVAAVDCVKRELAHEAAECTRAVELATAQLDTALSERDHALTQIDQRDVELRGLRELNAGVCRERDAERAGREQAEKMALVARDDVAAQRDQLREDINHSKRELKAAIDRLEGVESHSLREIERARADANVSITALNDQRKREATEAKMTVNRHENIARELRSEVTDLQRQLALTEQTAVSHANRVKQLDLLLAQANQQVDHITKNNASLLRSLNSLVEQSNKKKL